MVEDLHERVGKLETIVSQHELKWNSQIDKNESLIKLATLMEMQLKDSEIREQRQEIRDEKQNKQMEKFSSTLERIDENLTNLNSSQQQLQKEVVQIGNRVEDIEKKADENKIDPVKVFVKTLAWIAGAIGTIIITYVLFKLGLSNNN